MMNRPVIGLACAPMISDEKYARYAAIIQRAGGTGVRLPLVRAGAVRYDEEGRMEDGQLSAPGMLNEAIARTIRKRDFSGSNIGEVMRGIDGVFMPGGNDVAPCLLKTPVPVSNRGETIEVERDISDYLLAAYCIEKDIPLLAVCHGEQILGAVEGCTLIQDMETEYSREVALAHRMPRDAEKRDYMRGDIYITDEDSAIARAAGAGVIRNAALWHHQCLGSAEGSGLKVTGVTRVGETEIIQAVERKDLRFCVGLQFHPEIDCGADLDTAEKCRCDENICRAFFANLVEASARQ